MMTTGTNPRDTDNTWPVRLISILFIMQIVAILLTVLYYFSQVDPLIWESLELGLFSQPDDLALNNFTVVLFYLTPMILLLAVATVGVLFLWSGGWIVGMLAECAILLVSISYYFFHPLQAMYPLMFWAVFMVLVLNLSYVRQTLLRQRPADQLLVLGGSPTFEEP